MGALRNFIDVLRSSVALQICTAVLAILAYPLYQVLFNLYLHPLAKIPGPRLWCASRIPFVYHLLAGTLVQRQRALHERYGPVFRMAPDEVSFASEEAWDDIYTWRKGHGRAARDPAFAVAPPGQADNLITTSDARFHARVRGLMSHSFTDDALRAQQPLVEAHADMFVHQLWRAATAADAAAAGALVNMTDWFNFFTMDVIGDLALGESFGCLARGAYHDWVRTLYDYLAAMTVAAAPRYWPVLQFLLEQLIPRAVLAGQARHQQYAADKINRRLDSRAERPDFITPFMKKNPNFEGMSRAEILSTFSFVIVGGAETSATVLTGLLSHLCAPQNGHMLARLTGDVRARFAAEADIRGAAVRAGALPYLDAVVSEALRLCHPVPGGLPRMVPAGGDTYAGVALPAGTRLGVRIHAVNRAARYFHDPDTFAPERWLAEGAYAGDRLSASRPFSVGFHSCLGRALALLELRLLTARLLWAFDVAAADGTRFDDFPVQMMVRKQALAVRVRARAGVAYKGVDLEQQQQRERV